MAELKVIIESSSILTPLGNLHSTAQSLLECKSAVKKENLFNLNIPFASFENDQNRSILNAFNEVFKTLNLKNCNADNTVIIFAAAKGDLSGLEGQFNPEDNLLEITSPLLDAQCSLLAESINLKSAKQIVISNACASGQVALETAKELLEDKCYEYALVLGYDALYNFTVSGFNSLGALSHSFGARPFDIERDGLTMGECAGATLLSFRIPSSNDVIIVGAGSSNDANHRTGPSRTGDGLYKAMKSSLEDGNIQPDEIGGVKCHGTSTNYNDAMEAKALFTLFEDNCPPASSLKGALGHMSGGGSLVEVLIGSELLLKKTLPPTIGFNKKGVEEPIKISDKCQKIRSNKLLCLAAGFGGLNSSLILERAV